VLSNALVALGVAFLIVFPLRAPAYYACRDFGRYDWRVEKAIPELRGRVVVQDAATPRTLKRYASMPEGAIYLFD